MLGVQDQERAIIASRDIKAAEDVAEITSNPAEQAHLLLSATQLVERLEAFKVAAAHNATELQETDVVRVSLNAHRAVLRSHYLRAQHSASGLLIDDDPDAPMSEAERARRQKVINQVFGLTANELRDLPADKLNERLGSWLVACEQSADLKPLKLTRDIKPHITSFGKLSSTMQRETREDREATVALNKERASLDQFQRAHELLVESVLTRAGRVDMLGRYSTRHDAGWKARRAQGKPLAEEPDAPAVLDDLNPAPAAPTP